MKTDNVNPQSIDEYIDSFPPAVQALLQRVRATIQRSVPRATETIKYRLPTFDLDGNLVHFGAFAHHIGLYAMPSGNTKFQAELAKYPSGKGSIQFPFDRPIPFALIGRIAKFRAQENTARAAAKQSKRTR